MNTVFSAILDDFEANLQSLNELVELGQASSNSFKVRVASINSVTLILAATFEEFVRQMAREHAVQTVCKARKLSNVPNKLLETAWRRTLRDLDKIRFSQNSKKELIASEVSDARKKFETVCRFLEGDVGQNIFEDLIHNENNMRAREINSLFRISGTSNICKRLCENDSLKGYFKEEDSGKINGELMANLDDFFDRRNNIAHSLNAAESVGPETLIGEIGFFRALARDLSAFLEGTLG